MDEVELQISQRMGVSTYHGALINKSDKLYVWGTNKKGNIPFSLPHIEFPLQVKLTIRDEKDKYSMPQEYLAKSVATGRFHTVAIAYLKGIPRGKFTRFTQFQHIFDRIKLRSKDTTLSEFFKKPEAQLFRMNSNQGGTDGSRMSMDMSNEISGAQARNTQRDDIFVGGIEKPPVMFEDKRNKSQIIGEDDLEEDCVAEIIDKSKFREVLKALQIYTKDIDDLLYEFGKNKKGNMNTVNLSDLKDQINGYRSDDGRVFTFGYHDERLGVKPKVLLPMDLKRGFTHKSKQESVEPNVSMVKFPKNTYPIIAIACGSAHTLALAQDGKLYTWGDGTYGGLGRGRRVSEYIPMHVSVSKHGSERECKMIAAGSLHSMCLTKQNEIFTWGTGSGGRLGLNHAEDSLQPQEIESLNDQCPLFIAAGESHSAAISNYYQLWTWGMGSFGRLGHGLDCNELMPKLVEDLVDEKIIYVSCGVFHTLVLTKNGSLYGFGEDKYGKLATKVDDEASVNIQDVPTIIPMRMKDNDIIIQVFAGYNQSYALTLNGKLLSWGHEGSFLLGRVVKSPEDPRNKPLPITQTGEKTESTGQRKLMNCSPNTLIGINLDSEMIMEEQIVSTKVVEIGCSTYNTMAVTDGGELFVMGAKEFGHTGKPRDTFREFTREEPISVPFFSTHSNNRVFMVGVGIGHVLCVTRSRQLYAWGTNKQGQLGLGTISDIVYSPVYVQAMSGVNCKFCACGNNYSAVLNDFGELWTFGSLSYGRLGIGEFFRDDSQVMPRKVDSDVHFISLSCGTYHTLGIGNDGVVYSWGSNFHGQLGVGSKENKYVPTIVKDALSTEFITKVCCGLNHSLALNSMGKLFYWGDYKFATRAELFTDVETPIQMNFSVGDIFIDIASAHTVNLALTQKSEIYVWGKFASDFHEHDVESGLTVVKNYLPYKITTSAKEKVFPKRLWVAPNHGVALSKSDILYSWGLPSTGRLGHGDTESDEFINEPRLVVSLNKILQKYKAELLHRRNEKNFISQMKAPGDRDEVEEEKAAGEGGREEEKEFEYVAPLENKTFTMNDMKSLQMNLIKESESNMNEDALFIEDKECQQKLKDLLDSMKDVQEYNEKHEEMHIHLQSSLIARIKDPPFKIPRPDFVLNQDKLFPHGYSENKKEIKEIITAFHIHPCYLAEIYKQNFLKTPIVMFEFIKEIYGNPFDDNRQIVLLLSLAKLTFIKEMKDCQSLEKIDFFQPSSLFGKIFRYIFENQSDNMKYCAQIVAFLFDIMNQKLGPKSQEQTKVAFTLIAKPRHRRILGDTIKSVEEIVKKRCSILRVITETMIENIMQNQIISGQHSADNFNITSSEGFTKEVHFLLHFCGNKLRKHFPSEEDVDENVRFIIGTKLLPFIFSNVHQILRSNMQQLFLYVKPKEGKDVEMLNMELKLHSGNFKVIASIIQYYFAGTECFKKNHFDSFIREFNMELFQSSKVYNNKLMSIFEKRTSKHSLSFWNFHQKFDHILEDQIPAVTISMKTIKYLLKVMHNHINDLIQVVPREKDQLFINYGIIYKRGTFKFKKITNDDNRKVVIRMKKPELLVGIRKCKLCECMLTAKYVTPICTPAMNLYDPADTQSMSSLFEGILKKGRKLRLTDTLDDYFNLERKAALKSGEYERVEIIEMFLEKVAAEVKCELKKKGIINRKHKEKKIKNDLYNEIFKEVESRQNRKLDHFSYLKEVNKDVFNKIQDKVKNKITLIEKEDDEPLYFTDLLDNIQYGLANKEIEKYINAQNGLVKMQKTLEFAKAHALSKDLFENLLRVEKCKLLPFSKRSINFLIKKNIIEKIWVEKFNLIKDKCSLIFMFQTTHDINLKLVYQDNFVFKPSKESVEITLFNWILTAKDVLMYRKTACKTEMKATILIGDYISFYKFNLVRFINKIEKHTLCYKQNTKGLDQEDDEDV